MTLTRRKMLTSTISSIGLLGAACAFGQNDESCARTPAQPEGPFYPISDQPDKNTDLTYVEGRSGKALGEVIYVRGIVSDPQCRPIYNAVVEIWQACATGRYNHPGDRDNPSALDTNFQYWGIATTNRRGEYQFKTIIPGHYLAAPGWMRPPHIHFKVHRRGYFELTTQMYFAGNVYNDGDLILKNVPDDQKPSVVVELTPSSSNDATYECHFNPTLVPVR